MDRFRIKSNITGEHGREVLKAGTVAGREEFPPNADFAFLLNSGAIEVFGTRPALSLLPDAPSDQQYRDEIERLQAALMEAHDELDRVKGGRPAVATFAADPKASVAADNVAAKLRDAERERDAAEREAEGMRAEVVKLREQVDRYADRVTELERAATPPALPNPIRTPDGREVPKCGSGTAPPVAARV